MSLFSPPSKKIAAVLAVTLLSAAGAAAAQEINNWRNSYGDVWMNGTRELCWRNAFWTPATGIAGCDGVPPPAQTEIQQTETQVESAPTPPVIPTPPVTTAPPTPPAEPPPVQTAPPEVISRVVLHADTFFDFDRSSLKPEGRQVLDQVIEQVNALRELEGLIVVGHTDHTGTDVYNQRLSERRAASVKTYLVEKGVEAHRIQAEGKGKTMPIASNSTREGRAQNRRVEIEIVGTRVRRSN